MSDTKISALGAGTPAIADTVPIVQGGVSKRATVGDLRSPIAGDVPLVLTNVAGTSAAYTADATHGPVVGQTFYIQPHTLNVVNPTLSVNATTARQIQTAKGTWLPANYLNPLIRYPVRYTGTAYQLVGMDAIPYTAQNPQHIGRKIIRAIDEELGGVAAHETLIAARVPVSTAPYQITPSDHGRVVYTNVNGAFLDFGDMINHTIQEIRIGPAATSVTLFTGESTNWTDRTSSRVTVGPGRYRVFRGQGNEWEVESVNGKTITDSAAALPVYNRRIGILGYSNAVRTVKNIAGWREQFLTWGEDPSCVNVISGVGASSFLEGGEAGFVDGSTGTYNHWWAWRTSTPGPNMTTLLAAFAAQPSTPTLEYIFINIGFADLNLWRAANNPLGAALTEAEMVGHWIDALTWLKGPSGLNLPGLKFVICPMSQRGEGVAAWTEELWYAMRRMQLQVCDTGGSSLCIRGPDSYDVRYIDSDYHPTIDSQKKISARWARTSEVDAGRKSVTLGPRITNVTTPSNTQTLVEITPGGGSLTFPGVNDDWNNAPLPPGFGLLEAGADYINSAKIPIYNVRWSVSGGIYTVTLTHADQGAGQRFVFPMGDMHVLGEDPSLAIRTSTYEDPLGTYHPSV